MRPSIFKNVVACFIVAPLGCLGLLAYLALPSTFIFPDEHGSTQHTIPWHQAFITLFDLMLIPGAILSCLMARMLPTPRMSVAFGLTLSSIAVSFLVAPDAPLESLRDGLAHWLRFVAIFTLSCGLVRRLGAERAESLLFLFYFVLCGSALFVYRLQFPQYQRIYAAGMTVASFAQVSAAVSLIAIARRRYLVLAVSSLFLVLSFSLTSTTLLLALVTFIPLTAFENDQPNAAATRPWVVLRQASMAAVLVVAATFLVTTFTDHGFNLDFEDASHGHGRKDIWTYGLQLLWSGDVGLFGIGFGRTPECFQNSQLLGRYSTTDLPFTTFHSILLEGLIGLGAMFLPLLAFTLHQIGKFWRSKRYLPCAILLFFSLSQCLDFTIYRPKEIVIWAFMLGIVSQAGRIADLPGTRPSQTVRTPSSRKRQPE